MYKQIKTSSTPTNLTEVIQHIIINSIITNSSIPFHTSIECEAMDPPLCAGGCGFYGSPATENLCSKCYKCHLKEKEKEAAEAAAAKNFVLALPVPLAGVGSTVCDTDNKSAKVEVSGSRKRCECCNKKVGVIRFDCSRCGGSFCGIHRYPEEQACNFLDFESFGRAVLAKQNPVCKSDKPETRI